MPTKDYYKDFFEFGQQKINFNFYGLALQFTVPCVYKAQCYWIVSFTVCSVHAFILRVRDF